METTKGTKKRSRTGCFTCRRRKKKCDELLYPVCQNCHRKGLECAWPPLKHELHKKLEEVKYIADSVEPLKAKDGLLTILTDNDTSMSKPQPNTISFQQQEPLEIRPPNDFVDYKELIQPHNAYTNYGEVIRPNELYSYERSIRSPKNSEESEVQLNTFDYHNDLEIPATKDSLNYQSLIQPKPSTQIFNQNPFTEEFSHPIADSFIIRPPKANRVSKPAYLLDSPNSIKHVAATKRHSYILERIAMQQDIDSDDAEEGETLNTAINPVSPTLDLYSGPVGDIDNPRILDTFHTFLKEDLSYLNSPVNLETLSDSSHDHFKIHSPHPDL